MHALLLLLTFLCGAAVAAEQPVVLVSIPPLEYYVKALAGEWVQVESLMPEGANPHTYSPTPRRLTALSQATLWFQLGENFEAQVEGALSHGNRDLVQVNLLHGLSLIEEQNCPHCASAADPHVWLSARLGEQIAITMADHLKIAAPAASEQIETNLVKLKQELQQINQQLSRLLAPYRGETVLVSHAAFAYFCRDFGLTQLTVEQAGKEPSARHLTELLNQARQTHPRIVILAAQYNNKGATLIADELELPTCTINPLAKNLPHTLRTLGACIASPP